MDIGGESDKDCLARGHNIFIQESVAPYECLAKSQGISGWELVISGLYSVLKIPLPPAQL
jgi:hypothetical protein